MSRKHIPKSVRFEVFKRDSFACQYCGVKAPDAVLHVDHIHPVAEGGGNDILNLVTACADCNAGKGARLLSDDSALQKQRAQLDDLNERREQLEMMVEWRKGLLDLKADEVEAVCDFIASTTMYSVSDYGKSQIAKWVKKFSLEEIFDATETAFNQYCREVEPSDKAVEEWRKAFSYIPRIASVQSRGGISDVEKRLYYIRGILRNRLHYVNERACMVIMRDAVEQGANIDSIQEVAKSAQNWTQFKDALEAYVYENGGDDERS